MDLLLGFSLLHIGGEGVEGGGRFAADVKTAYEEAIFRECGEYREQQRRFGEPLRKGEGSVGIGYAVAMDLTSRPHTATAAFGEGVRHSGIWQVSEPSVAFLRRMAAAPNKKLVHIDDLYYAMLRGKWALTAGMVQSMDSPDDFVGSGHASWLASVLKASSRQDASCLLESLLGGKPVGGQPVVGHEGGASEDGAAARHETAVKCFETALNCLGSAIPDHTEAARAVWQMVAHHHSVNWHHVVKQERASAMRAVRSTAVAPPERPTPLHITKAASVLGVEAAGLHAAYETYKTPRHRVAEVDAWTEYVAGLSEDCAGRLGAPMSLEARAAHVLALLLGPGHVEGLLASAMGCREFLVDEDSPLAVELRRMQDDIKFAYVPPTVNGLEWGSVGVATELWATEPGCSRWAELTWEQRMIWNLIRVFLCKDSAVEVAMEPGCLEQLVESGDDSLLNSVCVWRQEAGLRVFKRRYQGVGFMFNVVRAAVHRGLGTLLRTELLHRPDDLTWERARELVLEATTGAGLADFLADKVVVNFLLGGILEVEKGVVALGPGALVTLHVVVDCLLGMGLWYYPFSLKPKQLPANACSALDLPTFLGQFEKELRTMGTLYLAARRSAEPSLEPVAVAVSPFVDVEQPPSVPENVLCEVGRRRAMGLAVARGIKGARLGKGRLAAGLVSVVEAARRSWRAAKVIVAKGRQYKAASVASVASSTSQGGRDPPCGVHRYCDPSWNRPVPCVQICHPCDEDEDGDGGDEQLAKSPQAVAEATH